MHKKKQQDKIIEPINMPFYELLNKAINTKIDDKKIGEKTEKPSKIKDKS